MTAWQSTIKNHKNIAWQFEIVDCHESANADSRDDGKSCHTEGAERPKYLKRKKQQVEIFRFAQYDKYSL
ncbi:hypothetical protein [Helicobacter sp. T3_23-1056]